jgi:ferredoxin
MKIEVDRTKCQGYGQCCLTAPAVFELDPDGTAAVIDSAPPEELLDAVEEAADCCPTQAILVEN